MSPVFERSLCRLLRADAGKYTATVQTFYMSWDLTILVGSQNNHEKVAKSSFRLSRDNLAKMETPMTNI